MKFSVTENTLYRIREKISNGAVGRGLRDVTRRQYIKYSTGKLNIVSALWIDHKKNRSVLGPPPPLARPTDEVRIGRFTKNPEV